MSENPAINATFSRLAEDFEREMITFDAMRLAFGRLAMAEIKTADPELHQRLIATFDTTADAGSWLTGVVPRYGLPPLVLLHQGKRETVMHSLAVLQGNSCA